MDDLAQLLQFWSAIKPGVTAIDEAHSILLSGFLVSAKPHNVLELGIGTAYSTNVIISSLAYNKRGKLTCVDNWFDHGGKAPDWIDVLVSKGGVTVITSEEEAFVRSCPSDEYDFLLSDADHYGTWFDEHCRIVKDGGIMFFHDTNESAIYPSLYLIEGQAREKGMAHIHFKENSRVQERCNRGFLMVVNKKC